MPRRPPPQPKQAPLTHFLCLPLVTPASRPQLEASLNEFRRVVTNIDSSQGTTGTGDDGNPASNADLLYVHPKAIRPVGTLHCTIGVMSLSNKDKLDKAIQCLNNLDITKMFQNASSDGSNTAADPLVVDLRGMGTFNPAEKTSVVYSAPTDSSNRLYKFCLALHTIFREQDLLESADRPLVLHTTIVNMIYAKGSWMPRKDTPPQNEFNPQDSQRQRGSRIKVPSKIDATAMLDRFKDFKWIEGLKLNRISLCEMGAPEIKDDAGNVVDQIYTEVASISLPT